MVTKWTFTDTETADSYVFSVNPSEADSPLLERNVNYVSTVAPDGAAILFEGGPVVNEQTFSGVVLDQQAYDDLVTWFNKDRTLLMTDELGREFSIYIKRLELRRRRAYGRPWKHDYTVSYYVLEEL